MADLSKVKIGTVTYDIKDAYARATLTTVQSSLQSEINRATLAESSLSTAIQNEANTRATTDAALLTRIENLEARGRFLSSWNSATGVPADHPTIPEGTTGLTYTYEYKVGDYYIVSDVPSTGTKYMPDTSISATATRSSESEAWSSATWTFGKTADTEHEVKDGDYYMCSTVSETVATWVWISNSQKTTYWGAIAGTLSAQTDLSNALAAKVNTTTTIAGLALTTNLEKEAVQTALGLEDLAYAASATGTYTPEGTIGEIDVTPAGTVALTGFTSETTTAALTKVDYTPAGSVTGTVESAGSITVVLSQTSTSITSTGKFTPAGTVKAGESTSVLTGGTITVTPDAGTDTAVTDITYENYTPTGTIAAKTGGTFAALTTAGLTTSSQGTTGAVQVTGTVSSPDIEVSGATTSVVGSVVTAGTVPSFTEGTFTAATISDGFFSAGSFTEGTLTQGVLPTIATKPTTTFATAGVTTSVDGETLIFADASTSAALTDVTLNAGTLPSWNAGTYTAPSIDTTKFSGGSKAADTWNAGAMPTFSNSTVLSGATASLKSAPTFTGGFLKVDTASDTALKEVEFSGTAAQIKMTGAKYKKIGISSAVFTPTTATLGFTGTEGSISATGSYDKASVNATDTKFTGASSNITATFSGTKSDTQLVTEVKYDKMAGGSATFTGTSKKVTPVFTGTAAVITVNPQ